MPVRNVVFGVERIVRRAGATVYWIDKSFAVQSKFITQATLKSGATYESESIWLTDGADHCELIHDSDEGSPSAYARIDALKRKAEQLKSAARGG